LLGVLLLYVASGPAYRGLFGIMHSTFADAIARDWSDSSMVDHFSSVALDALRVFGPVFVGFALIAAAAAYGQVGFLVTTEPLVPKFERIDPIAGLRRLISFRSIFRLFVSLGKLAIVGGTIYLYLSRKINELPLLMDMAPMQVFVYMLKSMFMVMLLTALVLVVLAAIDYGYQRYQHERDLRMTPEQVREELKRTEGDPLVKARVRQIQRDLARRRMMQDVPKADVVVRNPTHFAVALKYEAKTMKAPKVVAKGMNLIAERILEIARENRVPTVENKPLARALYKMVDLGDEIPVKLYRAVAEVLAYVYQLKKRPVGA
jgi:flagellar biosynthetic protein FlhB